MKKALFGLLLMANLAYADNSAFSPNALFDTNKNEVNDINVKWVTVDNINAACNAERTRRGKAVFNFSVDACSFWKDNSCIILTPKKTTMYIIGHEMRHCFQGAFH